MGSGIVFDIKPYAIYDGPGIRTTLFLKGCPLRCSWRHNAKGLSPQPHIDYKHESCASCQKCLENCSRHRVAKNGKGQYSVDLCPGNARELIGKEMSAKELVAELERDLVLL